MDKTFEIELLSGERLQATPPTDQQWIDRSKRRKLRQRTVKGETVTDVALAGEADLEMFRAITGKADFSDADEASLAIERLQEAEVIELERNGDGYDITLQTFGGEMKLSLKRPSAAHVKRYRGHVALVGVAGGWTELRPNLEVPRAIFDELSERKDLSIIHKAMMVSAVIEAVQHPLAASARP